MSDKAKECLLLWMIKYGDRVITFGELVALYDIYADYWAEIRPYYKIVHNIKHFELNDAARRILTEVLDEQ